MASLKILKYAMQYNLQTSVGEPKLLPAKSQILIYNNFIKNFNKKNYN